MYDPVILYDDGTPRTKHVLGNLEIGVDDSAGTARARCTFTVFQSVPDRPLTAVLAGRYHDRFERAGGAWRFGERVIHLDLVGELGEHLTEAGRAGRTGRTGRTGR